MNSPPGQRAGAQPDLQLRADCSRCAALCCVAPAFAASADFAIDKAAGRPCPNLRSDFRCGIHTNLRERGFPGCAAFDCFGDGQHVTQVTFGGSDWRENPKIAASMFEAFAVMRQLKELLWHLEEARSIVPAGALRDELGDARERTRQLTNAAPDELALIDAAARRQEVGRLLEQVSLGARAAFADRSADYRGADLIGADLRGADLRGATLRGAYLLGADLRGVDLHAADLLGADVRAADLRAAKLERALFLTQPQLDVARGDSSTTIPSPLARPRHWPPTPTP